MVLVLYSLPCSPLGMAKLISSRNHLFLMLALGVVQLQQPTMAMPLLVGMTLVLPSVRLASPPVRHPLLA
ncbi:MAG: hypothetical protein NTZ53_00915 [Cyanobacteria bacterium]|nr:hypothetical protein [Cyanobacteriota bacterium]